MSSEPLHKQMAFSRKFGRLLFVRGLHGMLRKKRKVRSVRVIRVPKAFNPDFEKTRFTSKTLWTESFHPGSPIPLVLPEIRTSCILTDPGRMQEVRISQNVDYCLLANSRTAAITSSCCSMVNSGYSGNASVSRAAFSA